MVPRVLSSQLILQSALIMLPEQEDLFLFQPHWTYRRCLGCSRRVTFCYGMTPPISSATATHGQAWPLVRAAPKNPLEFSFHSLPSPRLEFGCLAETEYSFISLSKAFSPLVDIWFLSSWLVNKQDIGTLSIPSTEQSSLVSVALQPLPLHK